MATGIFKSFSVGKGDCHFLVLKDGEKQLSIMIDCGKLTQEIENFINLNLGNHLSYLIVTHIDEDHIVGLKALLKKNHNLKIDNILYNCAQECKLTQQEPTPKTVLESLEHLKTIKSKNRFKGKQSISANQAMTLAEIIFSNPSWNKAWSKQEKYIMLGYPDIELEDGFGKLIFLSPESKDLTNLDNEFRKEFNKKFFQRYAGPYTDESTIFEILINGINTNIGREKSLINALNTISEYQLKNFANAVVSPSISPANKASIAFVWECRNAKALICGDADADTIAYNYLRLRHQPQGTALFTVIKVPHHGSRHNVGLRFWDTFDSQNIFISGSDKLENRPSKECLCSIASRPTTVKRTIHYTEDHQNIQWIDSSEELKSKYQYLLTPDCTYEFEF